MTTTPATIEFFWDPASPYTYLASTQIVSLAADCGAKLRFRPFLLGAVFKATGNAPPGMLPAKGKHMLADIQLWSRYYDVPVSRPDSFPVNSVLALRCALAAEDHGAGPAFSLAVMRAHWGAGLDVAQPEVIVQIAAEVDLDGEALIAATQDEAIKLQLRSNTEEAVERGAFGAPTMFVGEQMFWGNDRLELMRAWLSGRLA